MKKNSSFLVLFFIIAVSFSYAQSATKVTQMLSKDTVKTSEAAYFAVTYLYPNRETISDSEALSVLEEEVGIPKLKGEDTILTYDQFAYVCTRVLNIKTSLMNRILNSPRYAFRDLQTLGFIDSNTMPTNTISGLEALTLMTKCIEYAEENNTVKEKVSEKETAFLSLPR